MKRILITLTIAILLSSCSTWKQKRLNKLCSKCPTTTVIKDSTAYIETITTDTIIDIQIIPPDTSYTIVVCEDGSVPIIKEIKNTGGKSTIKVKETEYGELAILSTCKEDSLMKVIIRINEEKKSLKTSLNDSKTTVTLYRNTSFAKFCIWFFFATIGCVSLYLGYRYLSMWVKTKLP